MKRGDAVKLSAGFLALQPPASEAKKNERGVITGVRYDQAWDTLTLSHVRVETVRDPAGSWWPAAMWEEAE